MSKPSVKTDKNPLKRQHPRFQTECLGTSLTKQSFKAESDINVIMNRYLKTGQNPAENSQPPTYGYAPSYDFREAMEIVQNMTSNFDEMPEDLKARFGHNPAKFLEFLSDSSNAAEAASLGLLNEEATLAHKTELNATVGNSSPSTEENPAEPAPTEAKLAE